MLLNIGLSKYYKTNMSAVESHQNIYLHVHGGVGTTPTNPRLRARGGAIEDNKERREANEGETPRELDWSLWVCIACLIYYKAYLWLVHYWLIRCEVQHAINCCAVIVSHKI
jgi:hypothetical protein